MYWINNSTLINTIKIRHVYAPRQHIFRAQNGPFTRNEIYTITDISTKVVLY